MSNTIQSAVAPRLIPFSGLSNITTLGKTKLYELINAGEFRPVKLGRKTVFVESEVFEWVNERISKRGA